MDRLPWIDFTGQSVEDLLALEGTHRIDSLAFAFESGIDQRSERVGADALTVEERTVLAVAALHREVNNGGYDQFFVNAPWHAVEIMDALGRIGCPQTAAITREAIAALEVSELTADTIGEAIYEDDRARSSILNACDERFYEYPECLSARLFEYIKTNRHGISF